MRVKINGEMRSFTESLTINDMLAVLGIDPKSVVVERNLNIIPRDHLENEVVCEGDTIEVIRMVGGG